LTVFAQVSNGGTEAVRTSYKNDQLDKLAVDAETEMDPEKRKQMYYQMQQISSDDAEVLFLYYPTGRTAVQKHIKNFHILPTGNYRLWETWRDDV
jgi:peptide/nickel transport system substrate-binding protein